MFERARERPIKTRLRNVRVVFRVTLSACDLRLGGEWSRLLRGEVMKCNASTYFFAERLLIFREDTLYMRCGEHLRKCNVRLLTAFVCF